MYASVYLKIHQLTVGGGQWGTVVAAQLTTDPSSPGRVVTSVTSSVFTGALVSTPWRPFSLANNRLLPCSHLDNTGTDRGLSQQGRREFQLAESGFRERPAAAIKRHTQCT